MAMNFLNDKSSQSSKSGHGKVGSSSPASSSSKLIDENDLEQVHEAIKSRRLDRAKKSSSEYATAYWPSENNEQGSDRSSSWSHLSAHQSPSIDSWDEVDYNSSAPEYSNREDNQNRQEQQRQTKTSWFRSATEYSPSFIFDPSSPAVASSRPDLYKQAPKPESHSHSRSVSSTYQAQVPEIVSEADDEQSAIEDVGNIHTLRRRKWEERQRGKIDEALRTSLSTLLVLRNAAKASSSLKSPSSYSISTVSPPVDNTINTNNSYTVNSGPASISASNFSSVPSSFSSSSPYGQFATSSSANEQRRRQAKPSSPLTNEVSAQKRRHTSRSRLSASLSSDQSQESDNTDTGINYNYTKRRRRPGSTNSSVLSSNNNYNNNRNMSSSPPSTVIGNRNIKNSNSNHYYNRSNTGSNATTPTTTNPRSSQVLISETESFTVTDVPTASSSIEESAHLAASRQINNNNNNNKQSSSPSSASAAPSKTKPKRQDRHNGNKYFSFINYWWNMTLEKIQFNPSLPFVGLAMLAIIAIPLRPALRNNSS